VNLKQTKSSEVISSPGSASGTRKRFPIGFKKLNKYILNV